MSAKAKINTRNTDYVKPVGQVEVNALIFECQFNNNSGFCHLKNL